MYSRFDEILQKEIINVKIYSLKFLNFGAIISILSFEEKKRICEGEYFVNYCAFVSNKEIKIKIFGCN